MDSTSLRILAPVVVKPDTVSKNASVKCGISPEITKGSAPNTDSKIQDTPTINRPSFAKIEGSFGRRREISFPSTSRSRIVTPKAKYPFSW